MQQISPTDIAYLLLIIPGFVFLWTYRHFTDAKEPISELGWVVWSFLWGFVELLLVNLGGQISHSPLPPISLSDSQTAASGFTALGLDIALIFSMPFGVLGAILTKTGLFARIDQNLKKLVALIGKKLLDFHNWSVHS